MTKLALYDDNPKCDSAIQKARSFTDLLNKLYRCDVGTADAYKKRCLRVLSRFRALFSADGELCFFSSPGRTELSGNHTDHENGLVLAAAVNIDALAVVCRNNSGLLRIASLGFPTVEFDTASAGCSAYAKGESAALVAGIVEAFRRHGAVLSGFDAYIESDIPPGSGLSSSAAYEMLICSIINELYCDGAFSVTELAQMGRFAENEFFGKPCGLMDQLACAHGGALAIDFRDTNNPLLMPVDFDPEVYGYAMCIIDAGANHADLTDEYAAITNELRGVCKLFGVSVLRELPESELCAALPLVRDRLGDRAVLRCMHVYDENRRVKAQLDALHAHDFEGFLSLVNDSGNSSYMYMQNVVPAGAKAQQGLALTIALAKRALQGRGAVRVHGGGFAGTAQAFVPKDCLESFIAELEGVLGKGSCHVLCVRSLGCVSFNACCLEEHCSDI